MEIEAKFAIPDKAAFQRLLAAESLAGMRLVAEATRTEHDHYLDTPDWAIRRHGYACRLRQRGNKRIITFKGVGQAQGAIHQRPEHETMLPPGATLDPATWPAGPARDLAEELYPGQALQPLFDLHQTRHLRTLLDGSRVVAQVSLDHVCLGQVCLARPGNEHADQSTYLELEVELTLTGTLADLERVVEELTTHWHLLPETRSKYERALTMLA
ncbi:MAG: CYTH domain-containing protein [Chloroflexi bacterium]|nr:CYTH domain-containing protein [Chloroflexota bacterium]MBU1748094.1 CYTH domain-containing protein [Chloroflexota bacterium]MBU1878706.1 CYTH domain-containing protein [Chloroflexota bacterium]